jgi:hypothetical protein
VLYLLTLGSLPVPAQAPQAAAPGKIFVTIVEGEGAINNVRQRVAREPIVQVEDENRRPVAGAVVTFTLPQQGASATFPNGARSLTVLTDDQGRAVARGLQPNSVNGKYEIRVNASHQGRTATATLSQTNALTAAAGAAAGGISGKLIAIIVIAGAAAAGGVVAATAGNGNGNGGGNAGRPPTTITPGTPTVGGPQ